jgi:LysM repeat protein/murein endopeptidase
VVARPAPPPDPALQPAVVPAGGPILAPAPSTTATTEASLAADDDHDDDDDDSADGEAADDGEAGEGGGIVDDGEIEAFGDVPANAPGSTAETFRYSADLSDAQVKEFWEKAPEKLGSVSVGFAHAGRQVNAVPFPRTGGPWAVIQPEYAWGAQEVIDAVAAAARQVGERFPGAPPLRVNHISRKDGGWLRPHQSHQSGRDVDLGLYYPDGARCSRAREKCMDVALNWALVRALVTTGDVQVILIDKRIQAALYEHALGIGEDKAWLDSLFHGGPSALLQHARRHRDHFHVRYYAARSQELGRRVHPLLASRPENNVMPYRIKNGDSLGRIAAKFGVTVSALKKHNGMKNSFLRAGRTLGIPLRGPCTSCPVPPPVVVPPRRLPPDLALPGASSTVTHAIDPTTSPSSGRAVASAGTAVAPSSPRVTSTASAGPVAGAGRTDSLSSTASAALAAGLARLAVVDAAAADR